VELGRGSEDGGSSEEFTVYNRHRRGAWKELRGIDSELFGDFGYNR